jgi:type IV secretory pathway VirB10-like protein
MKRTTLILAAAAALLLARTTIAEDTDTSEAKPTRTATHSGTGDAKIDDEAHEAADDALAEKAEAPSHQPKTLPTTASERAHEVAFGKQGEAERLAHSQAGKHGREDADAAHADAANRAAHGAAASAAGMAKDDAHGAAGQDRAGSARSGHTTSGGASPMTHH